jgi:hypothetical protein
MKVYLGQESALTQNTVNKFTRCKSESELIKQLTPHLERIFEVHSVHLVNSEQYGWVRATENRQNDLKPEMFLCHEAMYTKLKKTWQVW